MRPGWPKCGRVTGIRTLAELPKPQVEQCGVVERDGFRIEKLAIAPEKGVVLPALLFLPERPKPGSVVLYLHDQGKSADAGPNGPIEQRVRAGETVLAVDLRGMGQTHPAENDYYSHSRQDDYYSRSWQDAYTAYLLGRSYVGMRADDILVCARWATERLAENRDGAVSLAAVGNVGIPALHAAVLEPTLFQNVKLSQMLVSWSNVVHNRMNKGVIAGLVHNAPSFYDLPDLESLLGDKLTVEQPVNAVGDAIHR